MLGRTSESPRSDFAGPKASQQRLRRAASGPCRKAATGKVGRFRLPVPQGSEAALSCLGLDFRLSPGEASPQRAATSTIRRACSRRRDPSRQCRECDGLPPLRVGECPYPRPSRRAPAHPFPSRAATSGSFVVAGACRTGSARKYLSCKEVVPAKLLMAFGLGENPTRVRAHKEVAGPPRSFARALGWGPLSVDGTGKEEAGEVAQIGIALWPKGQPRCLLRDRMLG